MSVRGKASIFRLPPELDAGLKVMAASRGEAIAVVARELLREGLTLRGVILPLDSAARVSPPSPKDFR